MRESRACRHEDCFPAPKSVQLPRECFRSTPPRKACTGIGTHRRFVPRFPPSERTKSLLPPSSPTTAESWWRCNNGGNSSGTTGRGESERVRNLQQDLHLWRHSFLV